MTKITYITHDDKNHTIEVQNGLTVMEGAVQNDIPVIAAVCGSTTAVAHCHCLSVIVTSRATAAVALASRLGRAIGQPMGARACSIRPKSSTHTFKTLIRIIGV